MKCEVCLELLEEYLDGELAAETQEQIGEHLITCTECSDEFCGTHRGTGDIRALRSRSRSATVSCGPESRHTLFPKATSQSVGQRCCSPTRHSQRSIAVLLLGSSVGIVYLASRKPDLQEPVADPAKPTPSQPKQPETTGIRRSATERRNCFAFQSDQESNHVSTPINPVCCRQISAISIWTIKTRPGTSSKLRTCCARSEMSPSLTATTKSTLLTTRRSRVGC